MTAIKCGTCGGSVDHETMDDLMTPCCEGPCAHEVEREVTCRACVAAAYAAEAEYMAGPCPHGSAARGGCGRCLGAWYEGDNAGCRSDNPSECAMIRERSVAGISDVIPACPIHGAWTE